MKRRKTGVNFKPITSISKENDKQKKSTHEERVKGLCSSKMHGTCY